MQIQIQQHIPHAYEAWGRFSNQFPKHKQQIIMAHPSAAHDCSALDCLCI